MKISSYHPFDFLRRLGVKDPQSTLDLAEAIRPTIGVGDASSLFPPILPPTAWFGGSIVAAALNVPTLRITAGTRGCLIRELRLGSGAATRAIFRTTPVATALTGTVALTPQQNQSQRGDVNTSVLLGNDAVGFLPGIGLMPEVGVPVNTTTGQLLSDVAYLAPGFVFELQTVALAGSLTVAVLIQDAFGPEPLA